MGESASARSRAGSRGPRQIACHWNATSTSVVVAVVAFPGFAAFFDGEACDGECGERVGPPPSEGGVEEGDQDVAALLRAEDLLERDVGARIGEVHG